MSYGTKLRAIQILCMVMGLMVFLTNCSDEKNKEMIPAKKVYDFAANAGGAKITASNLEFVKFGQDFTINNVKRTILFEHPISEVLFTDVPIPANAVFQFGIGISQTAWDKPGDGVTFEVTVVDEKSDKAEIFSQYIDPKNNSRDRKWFDYTVDLKAFGGQKVSFIFRTSAGPRNNNDYDWAGWSNPQITLKSAN
jgi:hypothetical protein